MDLDPSAFLRVLLFPQVPFHFAVTNSLQITPVWGHLVGNVCGIARNIAYLLGRLPEMYGCYGWYVRGILDLHLEKRPHLPHLASICKVQNTRL